MEKQTEHPRMATLLENIYYNLDSPAAFTGVEAVYQKAKEHGITRRQVREWMEKQYTYSMHKPARKNFPRRKIYVRGIDDQWQIDLADMKQHRTKNDGFQYLL